MEKSVLKVLILEDNPYDAELNLKTLHKENWNIISRLAGDEKSFREYLLDFDPDIVLSDYNLPRFNGMDALRICVDEKPLTPFIIVTGSLDEETAVDCIKKGAWDYVLKEHLIRLNPAVKNAILLQEERQQRRAAEILQNESEEHFRALTQNSPDIIMRFDKDLRHIFVNNAVIPMLNLQPEAFLKKSHHEMGIFDDAMCDFWESNIQTVFITHKPHEVEFHLQTISGLRSIEWRLFPEFTSNDDVFTVLAVARDITFRKRQEDIKQTIIEIGNAVVTTRNLNELFVRIQEILSKIIDTKNFFIALYDKKKDLITIPFHRDEKDHFEEFPPGKTCTAFVLRTGVPQLISKEREKELVDAGEIELFGADSESWLGVPLKIDNEIIGVFTVQSYAKEVAYTEEDSKILEFVSDQIALAISRKKDEENIRRNEQKQRRIIESSPDGLLVTGSDGVIIDYNSAINRMLRIEKKELRLQNFLNFVYPQDRNRVEEIFRETTLSGFQKNIQLQILREDGSGFFGEISLGLIQNSPDTSESFVIIVKDVTDRINYETNLKIAKEKAEESDRLKSSFLSNMSHEIRTPMNAIVGFAELLSQNNVDEEDRKEFISHINHGSETLLNLIDDIIDLSKIEAGQIRINNSPFRLATLLSEVHALFLKNLKRQKRDKLLLVIDNNGCDADINIISDSFRLRQIFLNLISNAIKFTEKGQITFGVKKMDGESIGFFVKDTGIGIPKEKQNLIFDRFRQAHESKTKFYGGTGLGLAISRHLTELMGGEISVISEIDKGSEFIFSVKYSISETEIKKTREHPLNVIPDWENKTILIAEDELSNYLLLNHVLEATKAKIIWAKDGREVVTVFKEHPEVDLVLMDIQLPIMNGYQATTEIKKIHKDIPVIAQTAYAMAGEKETSKKYGCDDYISKPIKPKELFLILSRFLNA